MTDERVRVKGLNERMEQLRLRLLKQGQRVCRRTEIKGVANKQSKETPEHIHESMKPEAPKMLQDSVKPVSTKPRESSNNSFLTDASTTSLSKSSTPIGNGNSNGNCNSSCSSTSSSSSKSSSSSSSSGGGKGRSSNKSNEELLNQSESLKGVAYLPKLPALKDGEYDIVWQGDSLGLTFVVDASTKLPMVKRLTGKSSCDIVQQVQVGDILMFINQTKAEDFSSIDHVFKTLKTLSKPILLRFRHQITRPLLSVPMTFADTWIYYDIVWTEGSLGLSLSQGENSNFPTVKRVSDNASPSIRSLVGVMDEIVQVNAILCDSMPFKQIMAYLASAPKPIRLRFRKGCGV